MKIDKNDLKNILIKYLIKSVFATKGIEKFYSKHLIKMY